jgi:hypothetical protein
MTMQLQAHFHVAPDVEATLLQACRSGMVLIKHSLLTGQV